MSREKETPSRDNLLLSVGVAGMASLAVLAIVGKKSYQRKVAQLTKEMEKEAFKHVLEGEKIPTPPRVWAVLTPQETVQVFAIPMIIVLSGTTVVGAGLKSWYGIRDVQHGLDTLKWITKTGPPPNT